MSPYYLSIVGVIIDLLLKSNFFSDMNLLTHEFRVEVAFGFIKLKQKNFRILCSIQ